MIRDDPPISWWARKSRAYPNTTCLGRARLPGAADEYGKKRPGIGGLNEFRGQCVYASPRQVVFGIVLPCFTQWPWKARKAGEEGNPRVTQHVAACRIFSGRVERHVKTPNTMVRTAFCSSTHGGHGGSRGPRVQIRGS